MNAGPLLLRRASAAFICRSCRIGVLRHFTSSSSANFQSYTLPTQPPPTRPRNADVPETSIAGPAEDVPLPRVHETRPPKDTADGPTPQTTPAGSRDPRRSAVAIPEGEAQKPKAEFFDGAATAATAAAAQKPRTSSIAATQTQPEAATASPPPAATRPPTATTTTTTTPPRRSKLRAPRKAAMRLTPAAVAQLRAMLDQPEPKLIKVGVRNRGCSGLAYHLEYVDRPGAFDETVEQDGVRVLVDSKALFSIIGSEMDWVEEKLAERFVFRNPNIKEECGCGESFMV